MSTILDALRKLQRERAAESPPRDLRGSLTTETPSRRARRRGSSSFLVTAVLVVLSLGAGYWMYRSGWIGALRERYSGAPASAGESEEVATIEELDAAQRELEASAPKPPPEPRTARPIPTAPRVQTAPPPARADTPEVAAERAQLEAALANARAAQEAQRQAELQAAAAAAPKPPPPPPPAPAPQAAAVPPAPPPAPAAAPTPVPAPIAAAPAPPAEKPVAPKPVVPKPVAKKPQAQPAPERMAKAEPVPDRAVEAESTPHPSAFPAVRVESIRWHPVPERRVASLRFERQNVPEAREGEIVAGVLVYRIDPGAVELRVGSAHRTVSPEP